MRSVRALPVIALLFAFPVEGQSRDQVERLTSLGQVWGFLKYFHPGVATGSVHWDSVLVAAVPRVRAARNNGEYETVIQSLLDAAGPVRTCTTCTPPAHDSLRKNIDFGWLTSSKTFGPDIARQLAHVRDNRHQGSGRYVSYRNTAVFQTDTAFSTPAYPSEGGRLLALFRFWNAARYFFPYMYVNGSDWNAVLPEFIPRLIAARDEKDYHLTVVELSARLNDAHVGANSPTITATLGGRAPSFEARAIDNFVVVWKLARGATPDSNGLLVGDVITHVDGEGISERRRNLTKYIAAGNPAVFQRKLITAVLRSRDDSATYTIERNGKSLTRRVAMAPRPAPTAGPPQLPAYPVTDLARVLPNTDIGYINMGDLNPAQVDSALAIVRNTSGLVMDVRNYPRGTMYRFAQFFNPAARPFVTFTSVDSTYPGQVVWVPPYPAGLPNGNPDHYRGRVAILVDERTQSHAEFTTMALRTSPQNKVIGSQTAGADGNVTPFVLPGGIRTVFTGLGVYYPDGKPTQRIGIVPDIEIRPTLRGLRDGRDEVLERALEYIRTGR
jgi:carboxyl-terminal processing protease